MNKTTEELKEFFNDLYKIKGTSLPLQFLKMEEGNFKRLINSLPHKTLQETYDKLVKSKELAERLMTNKLNQNDYISSNN